MFFGLLYRWRVLCPRTSATDEASTHRMFRLLLVRRSLRHSLASSISCRTVGDTHPFFIWSRINHGERGWMSKELIVAELDYAFISPAITGDDQTQICSPR